MIDLNSLVLFAEVAEAGSFSAAARKLAIPTSTVSRRVAEFEAALGVRLLERSTRSLRLTEVGSDVLAHARQGTEIGDAVRSIVSHYRSEVSGLLRLSAPPSIADSLLVPLASLFQERHPNVRVQIFITERSVDLIVEGVDLAFVVGALPDSSLIARRLLLYRHRLVASPAYLASHPAVYKPDDLHRHRLLAFGFGPGQTTWSLRHANGRDAADLSFQASLAMNDYTGIASALVAAGGIGELPPIVQPDLIRSGRLVEVLPDWRLATLDLSLVHLNNRFLHRAVRAFKDFAIEHAPALFPELER